MKWGGNPDVEWLRYVAKRRWLVYSHNKRMLTVPNEKTTIINENVGIVFLTNGQENVVKQLRLLLNRWHVLEALDTQVPRPFERFLHPNVRLTNHFTYRGMKLSLP